MAELSLPVARLPLERLIAQWRASVVLKERDEGVLRSTENEALADLIHEQARTVARCADELVACLGALKKTPQDFNEREAIKAAEHCSHCGGPYTYDVSIPSVRWNAVIRASGLTEYLCATCIIREFARRGESFTATLSGDGFSGLPIEVVVNRAAAKDVEALNDDFAVAFGNSPPVLGAQSEEKEQEEDHTRMDTPGSPVDSLTAPTDEFNRLHPTIGED